MTVLEYGFKQHLKKIKKLKKNPDPNKDIDFIMQLRQLNDKIAKGSENVNVKPH
jgi:hypothetical protein